MPFSIARIVPWGQNLTKNQATFGLDEADPDRQILGCGDGPASFNAARRLANPPIKAHNLLIAPDSICSAAASSSLVSCSI